MAIKMVREPSETPNINNTDDFIPIRYGYGNQNGYIKNKGTEIDYTIDGNNFTITSGRIVLQGVECDIDANGYTITTNQSISSPLYYTVYYEVDLENNQISIKSENDPLNYPVISDGDDLTHIINGVARLVLYKFISTAGVINNVEKVIKEIGYVEDNINKKFNTPNATNFGDYIVTKKKLVWQGELDVHTGNPTLVNNFTIKNNTCYEFLFNLAYGDHNSSYIINCYVDKKAVEISEDIFIYWGISNLVRQVISSSSIINEYITLDSNSENNFFITNQTKTLNLADFRIQSSAGTLSLSKIYEIIQ